jgi:3-oxoacyl-[acyl-carrier protein] reductase
VAGTFLVSREAAKLMKRTGYGRIVNLTSVVVPLKLEGESAYASTKAAVNSLTEVLARELATFGITVNAVGPTPVDTDLIRGIPKAKLERLLARQAIPRMGTPEDVANAIDFYLRKESSFITGQTLYLGGV